MSVLFLPHGGGPLPLLGDPAHAEMLIAFKQLAQQTQRPRRVVLVSAHWEAHPIEVTAATRPALIYDYYGFPPEAYSFDYPVRGAPDLAVKLVSQLEDNGIKALLNNHRGVDHGVFVPLALLWPDAQLQCVQLSLHRSLGTAEHYAIGQAIRPLLDESTWLIGSGMSFHNLATLLRQVTTEERAAAKAFNDWLVNSLNSEQTTEKRRERLLHWQQAPYARFCHPREEHLLPLHVCLGAAEGHHADCLLRMELMGVPVTGAGWSPPYLT